MVVALEKTIPNWNVIDSDGFTYESQVVMNGLNPQTYFTLPDSSLQLNTDLLTSAEMTSSNPETVVYKINPSATWNDGTPISAQDFILAWKYQNAKDCPKCGVASTVGYDQIQSITGSDNDKTVTLAFKTPFPDWKALFSAPGLYPAAVAAKVGDLTTPDGLAKGYEAFKSTVPTWSGGPYLISAYDKDNSVTMVPNPKWYGKAKPSLDKLVYKVVTDQTAEVPALQNNEVQTLLSQPSQAIVDGVKNINGVNYNLMRGPTWEHIDLNLKNKYLADPALRKAIFTAIDRKQIIAKTVGPFFAGAAPLNNHYIMPGSQGYKDAITPTGQGAGNLDAAKKILTDAGYTVDPSGLKAKDGTVVPPLKFVFTVGNTLRQDTGTVVQGELASLGIKITLSPTQSLGHSLTNHDFDMIVYAWVGTPFYSSNRDIWTTGGGQDYGSYSNPQVDALWKQAATELDPQKQLDQINQADTIMAQDAYVLPLYQKPVFIATYDKYINVRNNPTSMGPSYNVQEWGMKAAAQ
jgi:peptide/nickel transport system substrate-binding protein